MTGNLKVFFIEQSEENRYDPRDNKSIFINFCCRNEQDPPAMTLLHGFVRKVLIGID